MTAAWQTRLDRIASQGLDGVAAVLGNAQVQRWLRRALYALLLLWIVRSLALAIWSFVPSAEPLTLPAPVLNPPQPGTERSGAPPVDIDGLVAAQLFGTADSEALAAMAAEAESARQMTEAEAAQALAGIEDGAPETRLPLTLRGVVAASEAGLGQAVIEHRNIQVLYRVGDDLPAGSRVVLAKVMPSQVVIDNGGRYELLRLFEETEAIQTVGTSNSRRAATPRSEPAGAGSAAGTTTARSVSIVAGEDATAVAARYRDRLYSDPRSLADVVTVTAVREGEDLLGYRLQPGPSRDAFAALGLRAGDLVTAVNGLPLSDPANTVRLYQAMRSATQAVIDIQRGGEEISLTVNLGDAAGDGTGTL